MARPSARLDRLGRVQKDPNHLFSHPEGIQWLAARLPTRMVPPEFWALDVAERTPLQAALEHDPDPVAVVACPCKHSHVVALFEAPERCTVDGCSCERWYSFTGRNVLVFNSPAVIATDDSTVVHP